MGKRPFNFSQARGALTVASTWKKETNLTHISKLCKCLAFTFPSVTHPRVLVEKVFSLQN